MRMRTALVLWVSLATFAFGQETPTRVRIDGGADGSGQNYSWRVTNLHSSRIVRIAFPHYHGDLFTTPENWEQDVTGLAQSGASNIHDGGVATAFIDNPRHGLGQGFSAEFQLRIARIGADRRPGEVTVTFADGTTEVIAGVELPTKKSFGEHYITAITLAVIFLVMFLTVRKKKSKPTPPSGAE